MGVKMDVSWDVNGTRHPLLRLDYKTGPRLKPTDFGRSNDMSKYEKTSVMYIL